MVQRTHRIRSETISTLLFVWLCMELCIPSYTSRLALIKLPTLKNLSTSAIIIFSKRNSAELIMQLLIRSC